MSAVLAVIASLSPLWVVLLLWFYPSLRDWWRVNKDRELGSVFSRKRAEESIRDKRRREMWRPTRLAQVEHEELSPEFFAWARTNDCLDHPAGCQYCIQDLQNARDEINGRLSTKLLHKAGWEYTDEEIWAKWNRITVNDGHRAVNLDGSRR